MKKLLCLALLLMLHACANISKVATGDAVVKDRLMVTTAGTWNQFESGLADDTPTWTVEGVIVDALQFYVGLKDGELIAPTPNSGKGTQPLKFKSSMQPHEVLALFQTLWTRDGSSFTLVKLEPTEFVGTQGFRFEYSLIRKTDDVRLRGLAYGTVRDGELFLINYSAPRLGFFQKYQGSVEALARSARIVG